MNIEELIAIAHAMMTPDKGLIAMDESLPTCNKRFEEAGIPQTEEYRRKYRQLIVTTPKFGEVISGAILFDETLYQKTDDGILFIDILKQAGIIPGIKVDEGAINMAGFPGEKITTGMDGLPERLANYYKLGARFAKWRAVITIGNGMPGGGCVEANMQLLARYAVLCQQAGIVPIVEPEVVMDGDHDIETDFEVTRKVLHELFNQLFRQNVILEGLILKPNMVMPGNDSVKKASINEVAELTVKCLLQTVPPAVPGIAFLSGGQSAEDGSAHLNAMHVKFKNKLPWALTFSYSRAIQEPALHEWKGKDENVKAAQDILYKRAYLNNVARKGEYKPEMETETVS